MCATIVNAIELDWSTEIICSTIRVDTPIIITYWSNGECPSIFLDEVPACCISGRHHFHCNAIGRSIIRRECQSVATQHVVYLEILGRTNKAPHDALIGVAEGIECRDGTLSIATQDDGVVSIGLTYDIYPLVTIAFAEDVEDKLCIYGHVGGQLGHLSNLLGVSSVAIKAFEFVGRVA